MQNSAGQGRIHGEVMGTTAFPENIDSETLHVRERLTKFRMSPLSLKVYEESRESSRIVVNFTSFRRS